MAKIAVFAGTFDPFTVGHYDIVKRASSVFDKVIVAVAGNGTEKKCVANAQDRAKIASYSIKDISNATVQVFDGLLTDFAKENGAKFLIRGIRNTVDFEYEKNLYSVYKSIDESIEVYYLMTSAQYAFVSSTFVREIMALKGKVDAYISTDALSTVKELYK